MESAPNNLTPLHNPSTNEAPLPHEAAPYGTVVNASESCGRLPKLSETFRNVPNASEAFGTVPKASERKENHILTVREVARLFEAAGVTRTERSITNWCQPNRSGVARIDAYFDSNDRKYFITPQSVDAAIKEELAKAAKHSESSESFGKVPQPAEGEQKSRSKVLDENELEELRVRLRNEEMASRLKDGYITTLEKQYEKLEQKNERMVEQLVGYSRTLGQLENQLKQLAGPKRIPVISESEPLVSDAE